MTISLLIIVCLLIWTLWLNYKIEKEKKRNRILQAFIAGIIRSISDYKSKTDEIDEDEIPLINNALPIPYENILESIDWELLKDLSIKPFDKWLKHDRNIFDDSKYVGDGFNFMYYDFFDRRSRIWFSDELMSSRKKAYLRDTINITKDNVTELPNPVYSNSQSGFVRTVSFLIIS